MKCTAYGKESRLEERNISIQEGFMGLSEFCLPRVSCCEYVFLMIQQLVSALSCKDSCFGEQPRKNGPGKKVREVCTSIAQTF